MSSFCVHWWKGAVELKLNFLNLQATPHSSFILVGVYIHPQACVSEALRHLADQITSTERKYPVSILIILGDFNKSNLSHELPKYRQTVKSPTRDKNTLDHCYTVLKNAYRSVPRAALGLSDHCLVHLLPTYRQKLKSAKPVVKTVDQWVKTGATGLLWLHWLECFWGCIYIHRWTHWHCDILHQFLWRHVCTHQNFLHL